MNISNASTQFSSAITPFAPPSSGELANPDSAAPLPPIKPSPEVAPSGDRAAHAQTAFSDDQRESAAAPSNAQSAASPGAAKQAVNKELSEQELATLMQLKARDREVRAHEQAHEAVGGRYAGSASYQYERGPDGAKYAVAGEVPISLPTGGGEPEERVQQAEQVIRAALAPAEPSAQDRAVAAKAAQLKTEAQAELKELSQGPQPERDWSALPAKADADNPLSTALKLHRVYHHEAAAVGAQIDSRA